MKVSWLAWLAGQGNWPRWDRNLTSAGSALSRDSQILTAVNRLSSGLQVDFLGKAPALLDGPQFMVERNTCAMEERIIKHMNHDHQDSLARYLEYFCGVSSFGARNARLDDINFSALTIVATGTKYNVPIDPPMTDWSQARLRVVEMDTLAIAGLGRSSIMIKKYVKPSGFMLVVFIAAFLTFVNFSTRENFEPGSLLYDNILTYTPPFAKFCWSIQPFVIYPMVLLHGGEAIYMARSRLANHHVPVGSRLWLTWVCSTFIEGYGNFVRFDALVEEERKRKAKVAH